MKIFIPAITALTIFLLSISTSHRFYWNTLELSPTEYGMILRLKFTTKGLIRIYDWGWVEFFEGGGINFQTENLVGEIKFETKI